MADRKPSYLDDNYYEDDLRNFKKNKLNLLDGLDVEFGALFSINAKSHAIIYKGFIDFSGYMYITRNDGSNIQFDVDQVKSAWIDWANKQLNITGKNNNLQLSFYRMKEDEFEQLIIDLEA